MECKLRLNKISVIVCLCIDLTRMECKFGENCIFVIMMTSIDLTRMECKLSTPPNHQ